MFSCGANSQGQCGYVGNANGQMMEITEHFSEPVLSIHASNNSSAFITRKIRTKYSKFLDEGLYTCGLVTRQHDIKFKPTIIAYGDVTHVAIGTEFLVFVTSNTTLYVQGINTSGQLGLDAEQFPLVQEPLEITSDHYSFHKNKQFKFVACGASHTLFVLTNNEIYLTGSNSKGQLAATLHVKRNFPPTFLHFLEFKNKEITHVACGNNFNMIVVNNRTVYGFGSNEYHQLGVEGDARGIPYPVELLSPLLENVLIDSVHCGQNYVLLNTSNGIIACGEASENRLATGDPYLYLTKVPIRSTLNTIRYDFDIYCGPFSNHTFFIRKEKAISKHFKLFKSFIDIVIVQ